MQMKTNLTKDEMTKFIAYLEDKQAYCRKLGLSFSMIQGIQLCIVDLKIERKKIEDGIKQEP